MQTSLALRTAALRLGPVLVSVVLASCAAELARDPDKSALHDGEHAEGRTHASLMGGTCVDNRVHWSFYGECAEDVGAGPSEPIYASAAGTVSLVYPSCLGFAGQSVRVDTAIGRFMYAHVDAAVSNGQWVDIGSLIGWVYDGPGPVFCTSTFSSCGVGEGGGRSTLCWSGPHLHREAPCCVAGASPAPPTPPPPPPPVSGCSCGAGCGYCWCGTGYESACDRAWYGTNDGCDCGCEWADPDCESAASGGGSFAGVYCTNAGWGCGGNTPCWPYDHCPTGSGCDWSAGSWGACVF